MRRRLRRSAGHIFSAPEWRVVPPAAHSFLSCQKRMGRKEALENETALSRRKGILILRTIHRKRIPQGTPFGRTV